MSVWLLYYLKANHYLLEDLLFNLFYFEYKIFSVIFYNRNKTSELLKISPNLSTNRYHIGESFVKKFFYIFLFQLGIITFVQWMPIMILK